MSRIKIIFTLIFINFTIYTYSDYILLKDISVYSAKIELIDPVKILIKIADSKFIEVPLSAVDYCFITDYPFVYRNPDGKIYSILKITDKSTFIYTDVLSKKNHGTENILNRDMDNTVVDKNSEIKAYKIKNALPSSNIIRDLFKTALIIQDKNFLNNDKPIIFDENTSLNYKIDDNEFYEKCWDIFSKIIKKNTESLLWSLIELYSSKEKYLNIIYNDGIQNVNNYRKNHLANRLKNEVIDLRVDFYKRAKKIINTTEFFYYD